MKLTSLTASIFLLLIPAASADVIPPVADPDKGFPEGKAGTVECKNDRSKLNLSFHTNSTLEFVGPTASGVFVTSLNPDDYGERRSMVYDRGWSCVTPDGETQTLMKLMEDYSPFR